ncbi:hypothetical protein NMG60_11005341 [Bertholletia excelsa]
MAVELDDGEFWLPPQFLTEEDILMDFRADSDGRKSREAGGVYFPSFAPNSGLSSPVESAGSSAETESDEEDFMAGLTRRIAHSTLEDDFWKAETGLGFENQKSLPMAGSPQSTLCGFTGGCGCKQGSSRGSPNCSSLVSSPPAAAVKRKDAAWDLLNAAAGEVARMRMIEERAVYMPNKGVFLRPPRKPSPVSVPPQNPNTNLGFHSNHSLSYQQLQAAQFQQLRQQQIMRQDQSHPMVQNRARSTGHPLGLLPSAWPTLRQSQQQQQQQQNNRPGSGMRAVFLGNNRSKRECTGTGVFLPRRIGSPTETPRKNKGCSTVLIPDRVVQALNLNLDAVDAQSQSQYNEDALRYRNDGLMGYPIHSLQSQPMMNQELRLPPEWTY